jgi:Polyketide cyclase / dehydrase and lipid transport
VFPPKRPGRSSQHDRRWQYHRGKAAPDYDRRIVYAVVAGDIPTKSYVATLQVFEVGADPSRCFVVWRADFDVDGDAAGTVAWVRDGIFRTCLDELERVIRGQAIGRSSGNTEANRELIRRAFDPSPAPLPQA